MLASSAGDRDGGHPCCGVAWQPPTCRRWQRASRPSLAQSRSSYHHRGSGWPGKQPRSHHPCAAHADPSRPSRARHPTPLVASSRHKQHRPARQRRNALAGAAEAVTAGASGWQRRLPSRAWPVGADWPGNSISPPPPAPSPSPSSTAAPSTSSSLLLLPSRSPPCPVAAVAAWPQPAVPSRRGRPRSGTRPHARHLACPRVRPPGCPSHRPSVHPPAGPPKGPRVAPPPNLPTIG